MKKLFLPIIISVTVIGCDFSGQPKDDRVPREDTTVTPIDTTIIEDGVAPVASNVTAKAKPQKKEKITCSSRPILL